MYINQLSLNSLRSPYQGDYSGPTFPTQGPVYNGFPSGQNDISTLSLAAQLRNLLELLNFSAADAFALPNQANFGYRGPKECDLGLNRYQPPAEVATPPVQSAPAPAPAAPQVKAPKAAVSGVKVKPLRQRNGVSCGQTSVAMAVNSLTGKSLTDADIDRKHGFSLLSALNHESRGAGYNWRDGGNFKAKDWATLEKKLNKEKTPVIIGLNGPTFSPSGRGHIVTLLSIDGNKVRYADPADGVIKTTTRQAIEKAPGHPQGKFFFYAAKA